MIKAYCDGGCRGNPGPSSAAYVIYDENGEMDFSYRYLGMKTNNYAEYSALLDLLKRLEDHEIKGAKIYCDSKLVVFQVNQKWQLKHEELKLLALQAIAMKTRGEHTLEHIDGHCGILGNERADELCNEALDELGY